VAPDSEHDFDLYRQHFGANLTTLGNVEGIDPDSSSIRDRMLVILRERQDQLQKATNYSEANVDRKQMSEFMKIFREISGLEAAKSKRTGVPRRIWRRIYLSGDEDVLPSNRS